VTAPGTVRGSALVRLAANGSLAVSTFIGDPSIPPPALARGVAVDGNDNAYVTGVSGTSDQGVWIDRVDLSGADNATFLMNGQHSNVGPPADVPAGIAIGPVPGDVYVAGSTVSVDFPTTPNTPQPFYGSGASDAFIAKVSFGASAPPPPVNLAQNKSVVVSSTFSPQYAGNDAVDGDGSTRWSSQFSDPQWIYVDLGQRIALTSIRLSWETAYGADYQIQVSDDAMNWTTIRSVTNGTGGVENIAVSGTGRFLRISGTRRGTEWGYSIWSLEAYGDDVPSP
jgi:hypothetical protein